MTKYLNLTPGFNPFGATDEHIIKHKHVEFSGGEQHIVIESKYTTESGAAVIITGRFNTGNDLFKLAVARDALHNCGWVNSVNLFIPYIPGGRQDRITGYGEPLTIKVVCNFINSLGFNKVATFDPHSDVTAAVINDINVLNNHEFIKNVILNIKDGEELPIVLVAPDAGAAKKTFNLGMTFELPIIQASKHRDTKTGKLSGFSVPDVDLGGKHVLIPDDICDGGGTFLGLAEKLKERNADHLHLAVSHGIFSKGVDALEDVFDTIYTTDSMHPFHKWGKTDSVFTIPFRTLIK